MEEIYFSMNKKLGTLIPEKWEKVYLYASILEQISNVPTGELYFYYYPKSILKKNAINCYEIPFKFNYDEDSYEKAMSVLFEDVKQIKRKFSTEIDDKNIWTNFTAVFDATQIYIEYDYENLKNSQFSNYERQIIWRYRYLSIVPYKINEKKIIEKYLLETASVNNQLINKNIKTMERQIIKL